MAEWSYLWLQKQHLHGIDRNEAIRYMLEGAAARSETSTKLNMIDMAITKVQVELGNTAASPSPTKGFVRSLSSEKRGEIVGSIRKLQRQRSESVSSNIELSALLQAQETQLEIAKKAAIEHRTLVSINNFNLSFQDIEH